jgi:hypothetical protein
MASTDLYVPFPRSVPSGAGDTVVYSTRDPKRALIAGESVTRRIVGWYQTDVASTLKVQYRDATTGAWITFNGVAGAGTAYAANAVVNFDVTRPPGDVQVIATLGGGPTVWKGPGSIRLATSYRQELSRLDALRAAQGLLAETHPKLYFGVPAAAPTSGTVYFAQIYLDAGVTLTQSQIAIMIVGVTCTMARVGIWDRGGNLLASTANQAAAWESLGNKTQALTSPFTPAISGPYYAGLIEVAATAPAFLSAPSATNKIGMSPGRPGFPAYIGSQDGQTDLPGALVIAPGTAPSLPWIAFY